MLGNGSVFVLFLERMAAGEYSRFLSFTHVETHTHFLTTHRNVGWAEPDGLRAVVKMTVFLSHHWSSNSPSLSPLFDPKSCVKLLSIRV